jgi:hypothetical protein
MVIKNRHYSDTFAGSGRLRLLGLFLVMLALMVSVLPAPSWSEDDVRLVVQLIASPASADADSLTPNLVSDGDALYLSWLERTETGHALRFSKWGGAGFEEARTIHTSDAFFANWADFASLAVVDGALAAHWLEKSGEGSYEYDVFV